MPSVFFSYSCEDLPLIQQLETDLKKHSDLSIWRDQEKIYGGEKWPRVLGEAIADQDVFLLAWSKNAAASYFVEFEWCTAIALKKTIVPCLLDNTPLTPSLQTFHGYRLDNLTRLIKSLRAAPLADVQRRSPVIANLATVTATDEEMVLRQAKTLFAQHAWILLGNIYQDIHIHHASVSPDTLKELKTLGITEAALANFFHTLDRTQVPANELDHELRKIAHSYLELKTRVAQFSSEDSEVQDLLGKARRAVETVDFPLAEQLFNETSRRDEEVAHRLQQVATARLASAAAAQAANGEVRAIQFDFIKARDYYQQALTLLPAMNTEHRGTYLLKLGDVLGEAGIRTSGVEIQTFLGESVETYRTALTIYTKDALPRDWARVQNNLGNVLRHQGTRTSGKAGTQLLAQAVEAYHSALTVRTKETLPHDWAATQNNLGNVLAEQGTRTVGETSTHLLSQAVEAYRATLEIYTMESIPQRWAAIQNNLGATLNDQGKRTDGEAGTQLLAEAVIAYRKALTIYTKDVLPQQWAMTQNNLGTALGEQGTRTSGEAGTQLLAQSVEAYRSALTVRTKETLPQDWAHTQNNLGIMLARQSTHISSEAGTQLLAEAAIAYRKALTIYTKDVLPQQWAMTQNNLGNTLGRQGTRIGGENGRCLLRQAIEAYQLALQVRTKEALPFQWEKTMNNLKFAENILADM